MTEPVKNNTQVKKSNAEINFYAQPKAGHFNSGNGDYCKLGLALGGQVKLKDGTYAKAEIAGGTYRGANLSVGHEFNIGKNMGIDLSANGQYMQNNSKSTYDIIVNFPDVTCYKKSLHWNDGDSRISAKAMLNFKGNAGKIGVGAEGGYRINHGIDYNGEFNYHNENVNSQTKVHFNSLHKGSFITPKLEGELNISKNKKWQLIGNADLIQQEAGIRYNF